ncbi:MAG: hypothetical protein GKS06_14075 [Acidobacteria bacterium]|nr:hypothetical protein [Acidobacteriota bacterium]
MNGKSRVAAFRADARRLLKQLRAGGDHARPAARRFRHLQTLRRFSTDELTAGDVEVRLKHALTVIATEAGFPSWPQLKSFCELDVLPATTPPMHVGRMESLLNTWFADHSEARASREASGGYLLPYRKQYFVCGPEGVQLLGLDPQDPDWARIGFDFAQPEDSDAWARLAKRRWTSIAQQEEQVQ